MPNPFAAATAALNGLEQVNRPKQVAPPSIEDNVAASAQRLRSEMPNEVDQADIAPMSWLDRLMSPSGAQAITTPFSGKVRYNPTNLEGQNPHDLDQMLAHELTHVNQAHREDNRPFMTRALEGLGSMTLPYEDRPAEIEAFQAERNREHAGKHYRGSGAIQALVK